MAYSDNLVTMDPSWIFRNAFPDTWLPDNFSIETETFAKALQKSFDSQYFDTTNFSGEFISPWLNNTSETTAVSVQTPTVSGGSAENENTSKKRRSGGVVGGGKISKRKSRASKRATTTFINADVANFRQMVQEITGVKFGCGNGVVCGGGGVVKPEARRGCNRLEMIGGGVPTLDTSAFLLDPTYQNNQVRVAVSVAPPLAVVEDVGGSACTTSQFEYGSFCNFPTLESWKSF